MADVPRAFVIGHPVGHSRSPLIHSFWLRELGLQGSYERIDVPPGELGRFLVDFPGQGFVGGNVTIPHKEAAFRLLDTPTGRARRLEAANTLWMEDGRLHGDNTDGEGFVASLEEAVGPGEVDRTRRALVLGAGGAARAIVPALLDRGVGEILIANRSQDRAEELRSFALDRVSVVPWSSLPEALADADLLVNTTQLGMAGEAPLDLDLAPLPRHAIVADIVYVPLETRLLATARARGLRTVDGLGMLLHQAVPGFARWFGVRPRVTPELRAHIVADLERTG